MPGPPALLALDEEIHDLTTSTAQIEAILQEKQQRLKDVLAKRRDLELALVAAGREFPTEIIAQIINIARLCFHDAADRVFQMTLFRQVCLHWNNVVLNDPLFWKDATLMVASEYQWQAATTLHQARLLQHPELTLDLHVICEADSSELLPEGVVKFVQGNVGRLSHFELRPGSMYYEVLDQVYRGWDIDNYPMGLWASLKSLTVVSPGTEAYTYAANVPLNYFDVPILKTVTLGGLGERDLVVEWMSLPFKQFTSITLRGFINSLCDYFAALNECSSLRYLSIDITNDVGSRGHYASQWNNNQTVTLPCLTTLNLKTRKDCKLGTEFFQRIVVPALEQLKIEDNTPRCPHEGTPFSTELFASLAVAFAGSSTKLRKCELTLLDGSSPFSDILFAAFLNCQPTLLTLVVSAPALSCSFLNNSLIRFPPLLQTMHLTSLHPASAHAEANFSKWYRSRDASSLKATLIMEETSGREVTVTDFGNVDGHAVGV